MPRLKIAMLLLLIGVIAVCVTPGDGGSSGGKGASRQYRQARVYYNGAGDEDYFSRQPRNPSRPSMKKALSGPGISAWAIVAIILFIIFVGFALYYFYLLYPVFCKKERQYNNIELVAV